MSSTRYISDKQPLMPFLQNLLPMLSANKPFSSIPGPWPSLPFIGTSWQYFKFVGRYELKKLHEAHADRYRIYGPIVREEYEWGKSIVHIYDPADFEIILRTNATKFPVRPPNEFIVQLRRSKPHMYQTIGFGNMNGPEWLIGRKKLVPAVSNWSTINEGMGAQNELCNDALDYLWLTREEETNIVHNLQDVTYRIALESICLMCLDGRIGCFPQTFESKEEYEQNDGAIMIEANKKMFDSFNELYYGLPFWRYFTTEAYRNLDKSESKLYELAQKYIDRALESLQNEDGQCNEQSNRSVLKTLLTNHALPQGVMKVNIMDFINGNTYAVSNSLTYVFYHLAANPRAQEKLYSKIKSVMGESTEDVNDGGFGNRYYQSITPVQLSRMTYLKACVSEAFRMNSPVPGIMRMTTEPIVLSGYEVPPNTLVFSHVMTTSRLEKYFQDAHRYYPERWLDQSSESKHHPFAVLPFSYGARMCAGKRYAETEIYLTTARLIMAYKLELVPGAEELELVHAFMVIPAKPFPVKITPR